MISPGMLISERYEIIDKVGSGGMADVYNAKDQRLNRNVAIKILKQEYSNDAKFVAKFRAEAQSVAGLSHPNIVNVYDVGEDDNLYYIVMELVEGITLKKFIERKGRLEINEAIGIGIQIAQGIEAAHKSHIIHRDIKPQNIIISKEGKVKVTDFGIAKAATSNTITSNAMGSVHYISPEQARGGYSDEKSDIYSLGVTIYEMLSGRVPFEGESTVSVAFAHVHEAAVPLDELDDSIPRSLSRIVQKCMQKKPDFRYVNAAALILDLRRAVSEPDGNYVEIESEEPVSSETIRITDEMRSKIKDPDSQVGRERVTERPTKKIERTRADEVGRTEDPEETEETAMDPKLERILKICSGIVAVIIVVVLILCVAKVMGVLGGKKSSETSSQEETSSQAATEPPVEESKIPVPDLLGHSLEEAQEMIDELNLKIKLVSEESSEETNKVIRQSPSAGTEVEEYSVVTVYYSKGKNDVVIPDVSGYTPNDAKDKLEGEPYGLLISGTTSQYSDSIEEGKVIGTDPVVGSSVEKGTSVTLILSKGPKEEGVTVPNIVGKKEEVALELLEEKNLTPGKKNYEYSDTYTKGTVIRQSKERGTEVEKGTSVDYTVSLGSKDEATPTPSPTATPEPTYHYVGSVTISANPFDYEGEDGMIELYLTQGGVEKRVFKGKLGFSDFPHKFSEIEGSGEGSGVITMSRDGVLMDGSWSISFRKVAD